jgi:hypothetical protein
MPCALSTIITELWWKFSHQKMYATLAQLLQDRKLKEAVDMDERMRWKRIVEMMGLSDVGCKARTKALRLCGCTR